MKWVVKCWKKSGLCVFVRLVFLKGKTMSCVQYRIKQWQETISYIISMYTHASFIILYYISKESPLPGWHFQVPSETLRGYVFQISKVHSWSMVQPWWLILTLRVCFKTNIMTLMTLKLINFSIKPSNPTQPNHWFCPEGILCQLFEMFCNTHLASAISKDLHHRSRIYVHQVLKW